MSFGLLPSWGFLPNWSTVPWAWDLALSRPWCFWHKVFPLPCFGKRKRRQASNNRYGSVSHYLHKNLDRRIIVMLCVFGALGGIIGAIVLTSLKGKTLFVIIGIYLLFIGA